MNSLVLSLCGRPDGRRETRRLFPKWKRWVAGVRLAKASGQERMRGRKREGRVLKEWGVRKKSCSAVLLLGLACGGVAAQAAARASQTNVASERPALVRIDVAASQGPWRPVWSFFGYDEPNYTYAANGKKLLGELSRLSAAPVYIRVHNLLTSGDGTASLKWGSTNAYTEDAHGNPVYDWKIVDRIFDTFREQGVKPLVEVGFMPEALSTNQQPYRHTFPEGNIFTGWAHPPMDYAKWQELVFQFAKHLRERYGAEEVKSWLWEVWNEPDIDYWKGTREEFFKLYDDAAAGILRALPDAKIGGPDTTGAAGKNAAEFLRAFLEHCSRGTNAATGKTGAPLDFISWHPKGAPQWKGDHVQMGLGRQLLSAQRGMEIVAQFPEWKNTPVILGEWDPEGCAACSAKSHPENAYRNGNLYAVYTAEALKDTIMLAQHTGVNLGGVVTWSFEFEDQPYFEGFRELATNGIDKPVLNAFRMLGMLGGDRVKLVSDGAATEEVVLRPGNGKIEGVDGIATRRDRELDVLVWNYREEDMSGPTRKVKIEIVGLPVAAKAAKFEEFRIDDRHSNSYAAWQRMGRPQNPTAAQYSELESAGQLEQVASLRPVSAGEGAYVFTIDLPLQSISLWRLHW
jgi:xylan 1,4-beta-xylosidase